MTKNSISKNDKGSNVKVKIKSKKGILMGVLVGLVILLILGLGVSLFFLWQSESKEKSIIKCDCDDICAAKVEECREDCEDSSKSDNDSDDEEEEDVSQDEECETVDGVGGYTLDLGSDGSLEVPEGWYVNHIVSDYDISPDELIDIVDSDYGGGIYESGMYPVYREFQLHLTNGRSDIIIDTDYSFISGPYGIEPSSLPDGYEVVEEPVGDESGFARFFTGEEYSYEIIYTCDDEMMCGDYSVLSGDPNSTEFVFRGNNSDLSTADQLFGELFIDGRDFDTTLGD